MKKSRESKMKIIPWALIFGDFCLLVKLPAIVAGSFIVIGVVMLIERRWPEQWGEEIQRERL